MLGGAEVNSKYYGVVLAIVLSALISGCGVSGGDPQSTIAKVQEYREKSNYKAAIIELKNVLQKNASHAEARYLLGITYYDLRDYRSAEQELRRAQELGYERGKTVAALGRTLLVLGEFQKVLELVGVDEQSTDAGLLTLRARAHAGLRMPDKARELLEQALVKQPEFADALVELARLAATERKMNDASILLERAIKSDPKHVEAWLTKGDLARFASDKAGMMAANQKVLEIDANNVPARLNMASIYIADDKLDEARKLVAQARTLSPDNVMTRHMQAVVEFRARDYKAANDAIQLVLKVAPGYLPSVMLAGAILTELGSYEQAQVHLGTVLDKVPGNLYARKLMISSLARSGQAQRALEVLQPGLKQAPEDAQLLSLAGELYLQNGEYGKSADYFDKAAKRDPKNALARSKLGLSRMASGDTERAFADLESAVAIDSTRHQTDMVLVVSYLRKGSYDQALKAMESLEKKQPNNPVTFNLKAVIYLGKKDVASARKYFERALELQPNFMAAAKNLAQLDIQDKNPKAARSRLEGILEKDKGNNTQALVALAELGPALGATQKEQVDWLERSRKANPQAMQPLVMLARLYFQMGEPKKALEVAQQAQAGSPENPQFLDLLGSAQISTGDKEQALVTYRKLVKLQPKSPVALYKLAGAQVSAGEYAAAEESLKQALTLQPDFVDALAALVPLHLRVKRHKEGLTVAQQVQKMAPKSSLGFVLEGDVSLAQGNFAQAIKAYETAQGITKNSAVLAKMHSAYIAVGKPQEGDARLAQWLKDSPDDSGIRLYAAESALRRSNPKEAISHYEWLQKKQPDNVVILNNLAWAYFQVKDPRALETAERAYKLAPENPSVADTLGTQLIETDVKRGIQLLEKAAKAAPNVAEIRFHLAQGWIKVGEKSKARGELERALGINEKFSNHVEALALLKQLRE